MAAQGGTASGRGHTCGYHEVTRSPRKCHPHRSPLQSHCSRTGRRSERCGDVLWEEKNFICLNFFLKKHKHFQYLGKVTLENEMQNQKLLRKCFSFSVSSQRGGSRLRFLLIKRWCLCGCSASGPSRDAHPRGVPAARVQDKPQGLVPKAVMV